MTETRLSFISYITSKFKDSGTKRVAPSVLWLCGSQGVSLICVVKGGSLPSRHSQPAVSRKTRVEQCRSFKMACITYITSALIIAAKIWSQGHTCLHRRLGNGVFPWAAKCPVKKEVDTGIPWRHCRVSSRLLQ